MQVRVAPLVRGRARNEGVSGCHEAGGEFCGRSSGVERHLAKVNVVGSNPIARSMYLSCTWLRGTRSV